MNTSMFVTVDVYRSTGPCLVCSLLSCHMTMSVFRHDHTVVYSTCSSRINVILSIRMCSLRLICTMNVQAVFDVPIDCIRSSDITTC
jgi:hypothetical protein